MKTLIFDLDGTLLDSAARHTRVLRAACGRLGVALPEEAFRGYLDCKREGCNTFRYLVERCGIREETAKICADDWAAWIEAPEFLAEDVLYPDTLAVLEKIRKDFRLRPVLITARKRKDLLLAQIRELGLDRFFPEIHCVSPMDAQREKVEAARQYPDILLWIGDSEVDDQAAKRLQVPAFLVNRGFRSAAFWARQGVRSYESLNGLEERIRELYSPPRMDDGMERAF